MVGVNKLAQAIERVGFVAHQFALWVVPEEWFNSEQEPDFGEQAIMVCFLGYTLRFAPAVGKRTVFTVHFAMAVVKCTVYTMHFAMAIVKCTVYTMHFATAIIKCIVYTMHFATAVVKCIVYHIIGGLFLIHYIPIPYHYIRIF
jgi:hypothetical protein